MSKITIEEIKKQLQSYNWQLLSETYQNLNSELEFECDEGHKIYSTWGKIRSNPICPVCKNNQYKNMTKEVVNKKNNVNRILALDQSTHKTGWAIFDNEVLIKYGVFESKKEQSVDRCNEIKHWLLSMIQTWSPDMVVLEDIQLQKNVLTFKKLAQLLGILLDILFEVKIPYKIYSSSIWREHFKVTGAKREAKKKFIQNNIKSELDITVSDDEADAICLGKYAVEEFKNKVTNWE